MHDVGHLLSLRKSAPQVNATIKSIYSLNCGWAHVRRMTVLWEIIRLSEDVWILDAAFSQNQNVNTIWMWMNTGQSVGEVRSLRSIAGPSRHSCLADLHCWSTPLYIVGWTVADSTSVPVHWVAGTRSAQVRRRIHRLRRPGAQNQGAVRSGRTNHRSLQVRADTPVCSSPSCLWCLERVSNVIVIKFIFKSKNNCAYKSPVVEWLISLREIASFWRVYVKICGCRLYGQHELRTQKNEEVRRVNSTVHTPLEIRKHSETWLVCAQNYVSIKPVWSQSFVIIRNMHFMSNKSDITLLFLSVLHYEISKCFAGQNICNVNKTQCINQ